MFRSLSKTGKKQINIRINGRSYQVDQGSSVWAAMALHKEKVTRLSPVTEQPRSAYCAMGVCFECLVEIDHQPNRQACLTPVSEGMTIVRQVITETTKAAGVSCTQVASQGKNRQGNQQDG